MEEAKAVAKYIRISPRKMVGMCKLVRGKDVLVAKSILLRSPKKASKIISKVMNSAIANAKNKNMSEKHLFIGEIRADQGPSLKRFICWSKGSARPIKKRMTHLTIVLKEKEVLHTKKKATGELKQDTEAKTEEVKKTQKWLRVENRRW